MNGALVKKEKHISQKLKHVLEAQTTPSSHNTRTLYSLCSIVWAKHIENNYHQCGVVTKSWEVGFLKTYTICDFVHHTSAGQMFKSLNHWTQSCIGKKCEHFIPVLFCFPCRTYASVLSKKKTLKQNWKMLLMNGVPIYSLLPSSSQEVNCYWKGQIPLRKSLWWKTVSWYWGPLWVIGKWITTKVFVTISILLVQSVW